MTLYHGSPVPGITTLQPCISNHKTPLVYFFSKPENTLVYLSNAVEKCCKEKGFSHNGSYHKWGTYGFDEDGRLHFSEYYPNALIDTYQGVSGFIYRAEKTEAVTEFKDIPYSYVSETPVAVTGCEFVHDAYGAILSAAEQGKIVLTFYKDHSPAMLDWIQSAANSEYKEAAEAPEYRFFLRQKFPFLPENG